jgi:hypothetical protein
LFDAAELTYLLLDAVFENVKFFFSQIEQIRAVVRSHTDRNRYQIGRYAKNITFTHLL